MKIIIAAGAAFAFAGFVYAYVQSTFIERNADVKATDRMELASGPAETAASHFIQPRLNGR